MNTLKQQISLNDFQVRELAEKPNGTISLNDLRGKTKKKHYKCKFELNLGNEVITNPIDTIMFLFVGGILDKVENKIFGCHHIENPVKINYLENEDNITIKDFYISTHFKYSNTMVENAFPVYLSIDKKIDFSDLLNINIYCDGNLIYSNKNLIICCGYFMNQELIKNTKSIYNISSGGENEIIFQQYANKNIIVELEIHST